MPRANRFYVPGMVWHVTHRCHKGEFLLAKAADRRRFLHWLSRAVELFELSVLNYMVTSNHVHIIVRDTGEGAIARSMQLAAGRTAHEYNKRHGRRGAFWADRYHATAVSVDTHLIQCLVYVDLNMVRAGAVAHPGQWPECGFTELIAPLSVPPILDRDALWQICGSRNDVEHLKARTAWIESALPFPSTRDPLWTESIAVGARSFVTEFRRNLGVRGRYREVAHDSQTYAIRENRILY